MTEKVAPKVNSKGQQELEKTQEQLDQFTAQVKDLTANRNAMPQASETEPQVKMSNREMQAMNQIYLKPSRAHGSREKFNEKYRDQYEFMKVYVPFIAEHNELRGDVIEMWTKPFAGMPAEFWEVPTNKPVWGPRYLAEEIKKKSYHRLIMTNTATATNQVGVMYGQMAADTTIQRLDARPVNQSKSIFLTPDGK
jgi:hypothetical protein